MVSDNGSSRNGGNGRPPQSWSMLGDNLSELLHDITTIAELQAKLTLCDLQASLERARMPLIACLAAALVLSGSIPVALVAGAESLVEYAAWTRPPAYLLTAGIAAAVAVGVLVVGGRMLRKSAEPLERSQRELTENIYWIRRAIRAQGRKKRAAGIRETNL